MTAYHARLALESDDQEHGVSSEAFCHTMRKIASSAEEDGPDDEFGVKVQDMIRQGWDISHVLSDKPRVANCIDMWQRTALCIACQSGNIKAAEALIQRGARLNTPDILGRTPLIWAARHSNGDIANALVGKLLDAGCDANVTDKFGQPALCLALENSLGRGLFPALGRLILATDVQSYNQRPYKDPFQQAPLHWVACSFTTLKPGAEAIVDQLLKAGGRPDVQDVRGHIPLQRSMVRNNVVGSRLLIEASRRAGGGKYNRHSILHTAAHHAGAAILDELRGATFWEDMDSDTLDDSDNGPVKAFLWRVTAPGHELGGLTRPTADEIVAFGSLITGLRNKGLDREIGELEIISQAVGRGDAALGMQTLDQIMTRKSGRKNERLKGLAVLRREIKDRMWERAQVMVREMIYSLTRRIEKNPLEEVGEGSASD